MPDVNFILQTEVEAIWKNDLKFKKVHFILLFPNFEKLNESIEFLSKFGNLVKEVDQKFIILQRELFLA